MILQSDFNKFLQEIRPTKVMRDQLITGHQTLRERLNTDEDLKPILVSDFLQGSYRRYTAVRARTSISSLSPSWTRPSTPQRTLSLSSSRS